MLRDPSCVMQIVRRRQVGLMCAGKRDTRRCAHESCGALRVFDHSVDDYSLSGVRENRSIVATSIAKSRGTVEPVAPVRSSRRYT